MEGINWERSNHKFDDSFDVAILDGYIPTFGAAATPKHWHVFFFFLKQGDERGYELKDKGE
jgi:hypothetical protein